MNKIRRAGFVEGTQTLMVCVLNLIPNPKYNTIPRPINQQNSNINIQTPKVQNASRPEPQRSRQTVYLCPRSRARIRSKGATMQASWFPTLLWSKSYGCFCCCLKGDVKQKLVKRCQRFFFLETTCNNVKLYTPTASYSYTKVAKTPGVAPESLARSWRASPQCDVTRSPGDAVGRAPHNGCFPTML